MEFIPSEMKLSPIEPAFQVGPNKNDQPNIVPIAWGPPTKVIGRCLLTNPNNGQCVGAFPSEYVGTWDEGYKCENHYLPKTAVINTAKASTDPNTPVHTYNTPAEVLEKLPIHNHSDKKDVWYQSQVPKYLQTNTPPQTTHNTTNTLTNNSTGLNVNNIPSLMAPGTVDRDGFSNPFNVLQIPAQLDNDKVQNIYDAPFSRVAMPYDPTKLYADVYRGMDNTTPIIQKTVRYRTTYNQSYQPHIRGFGLLSATK